MPKLDEIGQSLYDCVEINYEIMPGKRKQIRTKWKADRKVQLANIRKQKAIRIKKEEAAKK